MSSLCESCDHLASQHFMSGGRCDGDCIDPDTGEFYACPCVKFERDPDE